MQQRFGFNDIFTYNALAGIITPRYNVAINNTRFPQGSVITNATSFGGLNLFNYTNRDIAGVWDPNTRELVILGFY